MLAAVDAALDRYCDHLPVSLRQLFFVLLSDRVLEKTTLASSRTGADRSIG